MVSFNNKINYIFLRKVVSEEVNNGIAINVAHLTLIFSFSAPN